MNDHEFYRFKASMEEERDIQFRDSDWLELKQRMDGTPKTYRPLRKVLSWAAVVALLLLLGQWTLFKQLQGKLEQIESTLWQIDSARLADARLLERRDTVFVEKYIYQPSIPLEPTKMASTPIISDLRFPAYFSNASDRPLTTFRHPLLHEDLPAAKWPNLSPLPSKINEVEGSSLAESSQWYPIALLPTRSMELMTTSGLLIALPPPEWPGATERNRSVGSIFKKIIPRKLAIEAIGAIGRPLVQEDTEASVLWGGGADINARFGKGWSLFGGLQYSSVVRQSDTFQPDTGAPPIDPPAEGFVLDQASVDQRNWLYQFGLRWQYDSPSSWSPFIQLRYQNIFHTTSQARYTFENDHTEVVVEREGSGLQGAGKWLGAGVGLWFQPTRTPWSIGLNGQYDFVLGDNRIDKQRLILETRIQYNF